MKQGSSNFLPWGLLFRTLRSAFAAINEDVGQVSLSSTPRHSKGPLLEDCSQGCPSDDQINRRLRNGLDLAQHDWIFLHF
jgi:hypothetical protein